MSLCVLLADKSTSIEKVFQMGLKDYGVEIKSVHNGLEVLKAAEDYQPNIIFADILLQKKNGYEVTRELSQNPKTKHIPVVLMWSPFMELDQKDYQNCGARGELEKPFEIEDMRQIFDSLVKSPQDHNISEFLDFSEDVEIKSLEEEQHVNEEQQKKENESELDKYNFFSISDQGEQQASNNNENIFAESLEKFKPNQQPDEEAPSFFNQGTEEQSDPLETNEKKESKYDFSFTELDSKEVEGNREPSIFSFNEEESSSDHQKTDSPESQSSDTSMEKNVETKELDSTQITEPETDKKLELDDFLFQPDSESSSPQDHSSSPSQIKSVPNYQNLSSIPPEVSSLLEKVIKDQLPNIVEKVVREELEKIFKQEMELKKSNNK